MPIALGLFGVSRRELGDRFVEFRSITQIRGDRYSFSVPERMPLQGVDIAAKLAAEYQPKAGRQAKVTLPLLRSCSIGAIVALLSTVLPNSSFAQASEHKIVVASKIDTEGALLGNMILAVFEAHGFAVESKLQLGPTNIVRASAGVSVRGFCAGGGASANVALHATSRTGETGFALD